MSATGNPESGARKLSTADLAAAGRQPAPEAGDRGEEREARSAAERRASATRDKPAGGEDPAIERSGVERSGVERSAVERPAFERPAFERSAVERPAVERSSQGERLDPLFPTDVAGDYRARWAAVQSSFVDDPRRAVRQGDELVAQMMKNLAESFAAERGRLEGQLGQTGEATTETLRVSLRRYRSFFERLLSL